MNATASEQPPRDLLQGLFDSDRATDGSPALPDGGRRKRCVASPGLRRFRGARATPSVSTGTLRRPLLLPPPPPGLLDGGAASAAHGADEVSACIPARRRADQGRRGRRGRCTFRRGAGEAPSEPIRAIRPLRCDRRPSTRKVAARNAHGGEGIAEPRGESPR